jgi:Fe-S oxidoreductase
MSRSVSDFLLQRLHDWGVRRIYGYPGDGINGIMGALDRASDRCLSVFRDELVGLFPHSEQARRLAAQVLTFAEFLDRHHRALDGARLEREAVVHGHCHQKALIGMDSDRPVLERLGASARILDAGCCGMAGAFGFEAEHYAASVAVGERRLFPAIRGAAPDALLLADGFSCREQIVQRTSRCALHLAEAVRRAIRIGRPRASGELTTDPSAGPGGPLS